MAVSYDGNTIEMTAQGDVWPKDPDGTGIGGPITVFGITFYGASTGGDAAIIKSKEDGSGQTIAHLTAATGETDHQDGVQMDQFLGFQLTTLNAGGVLIYVG